MGQRHNISFFFNNFTADIQGILDRASASLCVTDTLRHQWTHRLRMGRVNAGVENQTIGRDADVRNVKRLLYKDLRALFISNFNSKNLTLPR